MPWIIENGELREVEALPPGAGITETDPPPAFAKSWTPLAFMEEWTTEERIAFREFARTDPLAEDWLGLLMASTEVRADDPRTIAGIAYMVNKNVIPQSRADEVLWSD